MFAYCGNNPISRTDNVGEFWHAIAGMAGGAVLAAASELVFQVINHAVTGEKINWGDIATSAAGGAVYGLVMSTTGSNTAAAMASTATTSIIDGIRNGDSAKKIIIKTAIKTAGAAVTSIVPKAINKSLSGKYVKLNPIQKVVKKATAGTYKGKYTRGTNYLADALSSSLDNAKSDLAKNVRKLAFSRIRLLLF